MILVLFWCRHAIQAFTYQITLSSAYVNIIAEDTASGVKQIQNVGVSRATPQPRSSMESTMKANRLVDCNMILEVY